MPRKTHQKGGISRFKPISHGMELAHLSSRDVSLALIFEEVAWATAV